LTRKTAPGPRVPYGALGGPWWADPRPPPLPSDPSSTVVWSSGGPVVLLARELRQVLRSRRSARRLRLRSLRRRLKAARSTLLALERAGVDPAEPASDLIARWAAWDDEESARVREDLLDDLSLRYPDASDERLSQIAESFIRSKP
jgi:hypothetical protein